MKNIIIIFILVLLSGCQKYQPNPIGTIINLMVKGTDNQKTIEKQAPISESDKKIIEKATEKEWEEVDKELEK
mgnify:FL=1|jgi:hypothetical protein